MKIHPRTQTVRLAGLDIESAILRIADEAGLTYVELVGILSSAISGHTKYALRAERHPAKSDKGADEA